MKPSFKFRDFERLLAIVVCETPAGRKQLQRVRTRTSEICLDIVRPTT